MGRICKAFAIVGVWLLAQGCAFERPGLLSFRRAVATERQGRWEGAMRFYQAALDADASFAAAHIRYQDLILQLGASSRLEGYAGQLETPWRQALALRLFKHSEERLEKLRALSDKAPSDPIVRFVLGEALQLAGLHAEAVVHLEASWRLDRTLLRAAAECGWSLLMLREYRRAVVLFKDVVSLTDSDPLAMGFELRGLSLLAVADPRAAQILELARNEGRTSRGLLLLALAELQRSRPERAVEILELGFYELQPTRELYLWAAGELVAELARKRDYAAARTAVKQALGRFPDAPRLLHYLADFDRAEGLFHEAEQSIMKAAHLAPYDPSIARAARRQLVAAGKYEQALRVWMRGLPTMLFEGESRLKPVIDATASIFSDRAQLPERLVDLAQCYEQAGWWWEAKAIWQRLMQAAEITPSALKISMQVYDAARAGLERVDQWLEMLDAVRRYFREHYAAVEGGHDDRAIETAIADLENICRQKTTDFPAGAGSPAVMSIYGAEMSPLATPDAPLVKYFLERGLYLDLQTGRDGVELKLMTVLNRREHSLEISGETRTVVGYLCGEGYIRSLAGHRSGLSQVAGCATFTGRGFYVDLEAIRASVGEMVDGGILQVQSRHRGLDFEPEMLQFWFERFAAELGEPPAGVDAQDWLVAELVRADIEGVRFHEIGHIVDFEHLTPFWSNFWSNLWRNLEEGFSANNLATRFELVAESYALSQLEVPWPTLAVNLRWLKTDEQDPWFRWLLRDSRFDDAEPPPYQVVARELFRHLLEGMQANPEGPLTPLKDVGAPFVREMAEELFHELW